MSTNVMNNPVVDTEEVKATETNKEIQVPAFMQKSGPKNKKEAIKRFRDKVDQEKALATECALIDDLDLIVSIIERYGLPDKVKLKCVLEYDSTDKKNNKRFVVQR